MYGFGYFYSAAQVMADYDMVIADQIILGVDAHDVNDVRHAARWVLKHPSLEGLRLNGMLPIPNILRVSFMQRIGGFVDELFVGMEDYATWIRAVEGGARVHKIRKALGSCYRAVPGSMMRCAPLVLYPTATSQAAKTVPISGGRAVGGWVGGWVGEQTEQAGAR